MFDISIAKFGITLYSIANVAIPDWTDFDGKYYCIEQWF